MAFVYMKHPDLVWGTLVPDDPSVIGWHESRGWQQYVTPPELDPEAPNSGVAFTPSSGEPAPVELSETERILSDEEALSLKGQALDEALEAAGLSKSGTADEKRARLAEHEAGLAVTLEGSEDNG